MVKNKKKTIFRRMTAEESFATNEIEQGAATSSKCKGITLDDTKELDECGMGYKIAAGSFNQATEKDAQKVFDEKPRRDSAALSAENRKLSNGLKLSYTPSLGHGVILDNEDISDVTDSWGFCLVGYFTNRHHPGKEALLNICNSWNVKYDYLPSINGWILFKFSCSEDRDKVLYESPYLINGRWLLLKVLPDWFQFGEDDVKIMPVWIKLPLLPPECWNANALGKLLSVRQANHNGQINRGQREMQLCFRESLASTFLLERESRSLKR